MAPSHIRRSALGMPAAVRSFGDLAARGIVELIWTLTPPEAALISTAASMDLRSRASLVDARARARGRVSRMGDEEQEKERLNRKLIELLNELRIVIPGVQVLFAFLLILPFNSGFVETDDLDRAVYAGSLGCAAVASALLIGPAAYHRHRFRRLEEETASDKKEMIITQDHLAGGGILFLALAMAGSVFMVLDVLFGTGTATIVAGSLLLTYAWFWYALPVSRRIRSSRSRR